MVVILFGAKSFSDKKETIDSFVNAEYKQRAVVWMLASLHKNAAIRWRKEGIGNRSLCCDTKQQGEKKNIFLHSSFLGIRLQGFLDFLDLVSYMQSIGSCWPILPKVDSLKWQNRPRKKNITWWAGAISMTLPPKQKIRTEGRKGVISEKRKDTFREVTCLSGFCNKTMLPSWFSRNK